MTNLPVIPQAEEPTLEGMREFNRLLFAVMASESAVADADEWDALAIDDKGTAMRALRDKDLAALRSYVLGVVTAAGRWKAAHALMVQAIRDCVTEPLAQTIVQRGTITMDHPGLTADQRTAVDDYVREMTTKVIPEIVATMERRGIAAAALRSSHSSPTIGKDNNGV